MGTIYADFDWVFDDVQLGIDLKFWRLARGMKQEGIAAKLGIEKSYVSALENARNNGGMTVRRFCQICTLIDAAPENYITLQKHV